MLHSIGIIGPTQSVKRILEVAQGFEQCIDFFAFPFEYENEIIPILHENMGKVKGWLFTGPATYAIAQEHIAMDDNMMYCQSMGAGFYNVCLQIAFERQMTLRRMSVDMLEGVMDIEKALQETGLPWQDIYIRNYSNWREFQEIIQFHLQLWQEGKIDGAVTVLRNVYNELKKLGVPVYQLTLTKQEIYQSLKMLVEKVKASYFKNTQVCTVIIEMGQYDEIIEKAKSSYQLQELEWRLKGIVLPLCKKLDGYLLEKGGGVYEFFSSRGVAEQEIVLLQDALDQLSIAVNSDVPVSAGIGFGVTVFAAEINARHALRHAHGKAGGGIVIVQDDGVIVEAVNQLKELRYTYYSSDADLLEKLHQAEVGVKTYQKIITAVGRMGRDVFTVAQLAEQLSVSAQHIRRILTGLCAAGLAEYAGEESFVTNGRPGKMYRLYPKQ